MPAPYSFIPIPPGDFNEPFEHQAINMAAAHNTFVQGINAIVHHAPNVTPDKVDPFMTFCLAVFEAIHHHHDVEETVYFPEIEKRLGEGSMSGNLDEHHLFVPLLAEFEEYLRSVKTGKESYNAPLLLEKLHSFTDVMFEHLNHEIKTLEPARLREVFKAEELKALNDKTLKAAMSNTDYHIVMPLVMVSLNPATPWFPPVPLPVWWVIRFYFSWKHQEAWEFGAVDFSGRQRIPLPPAAS